MIPKAIAGTCGVLVRLIGVGDKTATLKSQITRDSLDVTEVPYENAAIDECVICWSCSSASARANAW